MMCARTLTTESEESRALISCQIEVMNGMSVQEHAAPESISTLANWPPKLALIFIRFPLLIMLPMAMVIFSRSARVVGRAILAVLFFKLIHEVYELFQQLRVVARGHFLVMLRLFF